MSDGFQSISSTWPLPSSTLLVSKVAHDHSRMSHTTSLCRIQQLLTRRYQVIRSNCFTRSHSTFSPQSLGDLVTALGAKSYSHGYHEVADDMASKCTLSTSRHRSRHPAPLVAHDNHVVSGVRLPDSCEVTSSANDTSTPSVSPPAHQSSPLKNQHRGRHALACSVRMKPTIHVVTDLCTVPSPIEFYPSSHVSLMHVESGP